MDINVNKRNRGTFRESLAASRSYRGCPSSAAGMSAMSRAGGLSLRFMRPFSCAT